MSTLNEALENFDLNEDTSDEALTCYQRVGNSLQLEKSVVELRRRIIEARIKSIHYTTILFYRGTQLAFLP